MSENKQPGCLSAYCHITGKRAGQHTNSGCSCLRPLPLADQLALKKRLQGLESALAEAKSVIAELNRVFDRDCDKEERLEAQIEQMKCCENCGNAKYDGLDYDCKTDGRCTRGNFIDWKPKGGKL